MAAPSDNARSGKEALPPPDDPERRWLAEVYQGDRVRQLSVRAIVAGMAIGAVMSISNLYVGLKAGWGVGVTITACIIAFAVFKALEGVWRPWAKDRFTILENNTMSSAASAAGYMASGGLVNTFPALYMTTGRIPAAWEMMAWLAVVSLLGLAAAVPLKRQLINIERLPFPEGIATAETLRSMHQSGDEAMRKARALGVGGLVGAALAFAREAPAMGKWALPSAIPLVPGAVGRKLLESYTLAFEGSFLLAGLGAIMGMRIGASLLGGAVLFYGVIGPRLVGDGIVKPGYKGVVSWTLWPGVSMMVVAGLLSFALKWRTVLRAFKGVGSMLAGGRDADDPVARVEVPPRWFVWGTIVPGAVCVVLGHTLFQITWWMGVVAVLATTALAVVAGRSTGETSITPVGPLGKITQLVYGVIAPSNMTTNLMTASITAGAAAHAGDLLMDLKSGYLLGGNPRKQTVAQLFGIVAGTALCVPVYGAIARPEKLGTAELPAPAARVWAAVAEMMAKGLGTLPRGALVAIVVAAVLGAALTLAETWAPPRVKRWIPSPVALGIAGTVPAFNSIAMFLGALVALGVATASRQKAERYTIPVASGLVAGESLIGVAIILWAQGPGLVNALFGRP